MSLHKFLLNYDIHISPQNIVIAKNKRSGLPILNNSVVPQWYCT